MQIEYRWAGGRDTLPPPQLQNARIMTNQLSTRLSVGATAPRHDSSLHPVNFGMLASPAYRVAGRVIGVPAGAPLAEIILSSKDRGEQNQQLGEAGKFEFQNVLPGSYTATVMVVTGLAEGRP